MERFIRSQNIQHYRERLKRTTDDSERQVLLKLLADEEAKQRDESPLLGKRQPKEK